MTAEVRFLLTQWEFRLEKKMGPSGRVRVNIAAYLIFRRQRGSRLPG